LWYYFAVIFYKSYQLRFFGDLMILCFNRLKTSELTIIYEYFCSINWDFSLYYKACCC
jgi:hypothetical protein